MIEIDYEKLKIGDEDDDKKTVLISQSADRPNAFNSYQESKKNASEVKAMFDRPFRLVQKRFNSLVDFIKNIYADVRANNEEIRKLKLLLELTPKMSFEYIASSGTYSLTGRGGYLRKDIIVPDYFDDGTNGIAPVKSLGFYAFEGDETVETLVITSMITSYDNYAFANCPRLMSIDMPGVAAISSFEFGGLTSLKYVKFGEYISNIGGGTFTGMSGAVFDFSAAKKVPQLQSYGAGWEFGTNPIIKVPSSLYGEWKYSTNWSIYADYIVAAE